MPRLRRVLPNRLKFTPVLRDDAEGDRLLKTFGETAVGFLRRSDCLVRVGADEFLALLWLADEFTAQTVAEWLRRALEEAASERAAGMQLRDGHIQSCFKFS